MNDYSELDDDFDTCGDCQVCGQQVHEAGAPTCDNCDPEKQADYWHNVEK